MARKSRVNLQETKTLVTATTFLTGLYSRLSVEDGDDVEQNSLGNQKKIGLHYLTEHANIRLVDTYVDNGYSGMNFKRPEFMRMMNDLQAGKINCVIVKDISRLGRHFVLTSEYVERIFPELGVRLICVNDDYDSINEQADSAALTLPLKMVMNDYYVKDISQKIRSSILAKMSCGEYLPSSGSVPYGYVRNPKTVTFDLDSEAAEVVRRIFEMRAGGMKFNAIAKQLNEEGIPCPGKLRYLRGMTTSEKYKDALWIRGTVRKITNDSVYIGNRIHGKVKRDKVGQKKKKRTMDEWQIIENAHEATVPQELFNKVQRINEEELNRRRNFEKRANPGKDYRDILRGKVFCAECGSRMSAMKGCARPGAKTPSRIFYDCNVYRDSNHSDCCSHYIRQETLMQAVTDLLNQQLCVAVDMEKLVNSVRSMPKIRSYQNTVEEEYTSICIKRSNMEAKLEQLLIDLTERLIDKDEYDYMKEQYGRQYEKLLEKEAEANADRKRLDMALNTAQKWITMLKRYQEFPYIDRPLMDELVNHVRVNKNKEIYIQLNYADPYKPLMDCMEKAEGLQNAG